MSILKLLCAEPDFTVQDIMGPETLPICAVADDEIDPTLPVGYNDFNLTHPTVCSNLILTFASEVSNHLSVLI